MLTKLEIKIKGFGILKCMSCADIDSVNSSLTSCLENLHLKIYSFKKTLDASAILKKKIPQKNKGL